MFISDFSKLISMMEGFPKSGTPAWRNNNPGNLDAGKRSSGKDANGYAIYAKISDGWADLEDLIVNTIEKHPTITLRTFFAGQRDDQNGVLPGGYSGYAPSADPRGTNAPLAYAHFMAGGLNIQLDDALITFLPPPTYPPGPVAA
jgi:hypothetical protein